MKLKQPSKSKVDALRHALGMTGIVMVNNVAAETILVVQSEMKRLKSEFSLKDAARIEAFIAEKYKKK